MSKTVRKESTALKFDTSSANLRCFIVAKSRSKAAESDGSSRRNRTKKKSRSTKAKQIQFQEKVFLESVVCKILNDADCEGITELIQSMTFPAGNTVGQEISRNSPLEEMEQLQMNQIFREDRTINKRHSTVNKIYDQNQGLYHISPAQYTYSYQGGYRQEEKLECTTTIHSSLAHSVVINQAAVDAREGEFGMNAMMMSYPYGYYPQTIYEKPQTQRKRRNITGEESQQYKIMANKIEQDGRTTLMIRHIPNKYSEEMLLEQIDRNFKLKINFLYLPIDNFNACNVGYAFVNFIHTKFILEFYNEFNGRRWDRFNSEKICQLAYARIQGTTNLMDHFQNSNAAQLRGKFASRPEDKRVRPIEETNETKFFNRC